MMSFAVIYNAYITAMFKSYGESKDLDDQFLTIAASVGMFFNTLARFMGGIILDKVRFKTFFGITLATAILLAFTFEFIADYPGMFMVYLAISFYINGTVVVAMPCYYAKIFGPESGSQAFPYFNTSNSISQLAFSAVVGYCQAIFGFSGMLLFTGGCSVIAFLVLLAFVSEEPINFA